VTIGDEMLAAILAAYQEARTQALLVAMVAEQSEEHEGEDSSVLLRNVLGAARFAEPKAKRMSRNI